MMLNLCYLILITFVIFFIITVIDDKIFNEIFYSFKNSILLKIRYRKLVEYLIIKNFFILVNYILFLILIVLFLLLVLKCNIPIQCIISLCLLIVIFLIAYEYYNNKIKNEIYNHFKFNKKLKVEIILTEVLMLIDFILIGFVIYRLT